MNSYKKWNLKLIKKQLQKVKKINEYDVCMIESMLTETVDTFYIPGNLKKKINVDKYDLNNNIPFIKDLNTFYKKNGKELDSNNQLSPLRSMDYEEVLSFVNDFYKEFDKEWYKIFTPVFEQRKNNIKFSESRSVSMYLQSLDYSYLNICDSQTIDMYYGIVHEYAHTIADRIRYRLSYVDDYPFVELPSLFLELVTNNFITNNYNLDNDVKIYNLSNYKLMLSHASDVINLYSYYSTNPNFNKKEDFIKDACSLLGGDKVYWNHLFTSNLGLERLMYSYPYLIAIELYYIYLNDPEYAKYVLEEIILMDPVDDYQSFLDKYGIHANEHSSEFLLDIKKNY